MPVKNKERRRVARCVFLAVAAIAVVLRIYILNVGAEHVPEQWFSKGEWVEQGKGYLIDRKVENANGYEYRVNGVEVLTPNEYLQRYSKDGTKKIDSEDANRKSVVVIDMTIENQSNVDGGVIGYLWYVVPDTLNDYYQLDTELFAHAEPEVGDSAMFSVERGYSHRTHLAFSNIANDGLLTPTDKVLRQPIHAPSFQMRISARPERKMIRFSVD